MVEEVEIAASFTETAAAQTANDNAGMTHPHDADLVPLGDDQVSICSSQLQHVPLLCRDQLALIRYGEDLCVCSVAF